MQYETREGQTIYDIILKTVGSLENTYAFILENPEIDNINYDFNGKNIQVVFTPSIQLPPPELTAKPKTTQSATSLTGREGQSLYDICLLTTNDLGGLIKLLSDNNISNVNETDLIGKSFTFSTDDIRDISVYNYFKQKATTIATIEDQEIFGALLQENGYYLLQENGFRILL